MRCAITRPTTDIARMRQGQSLINILVKNRAIDGAGLLAGRMKVAAGLFESPRRDAASTCSSQKSSRSTMGRITVALHEKGSPAEDQREDRRSRQDPQFPGFGGYSFDAFRAGATFTVQPGKDPVTAGRPFGNRVYQ